MRSEEKASPAQHKAKKRKEAHRVGLLNGVACGSQSGDKVQSSGQPSPGCMKPSSAQKQQKLGKRKAAEPPAPVIAPEAHNMPAAGTSQRGGSCKKQKAEKTRHEQRVSERDTGVQDTATALAPQAAAASDEPPMASSKPKSESQGLERVLEPQPQSEAQLQGAVRKRRNRNKFKQDHASNQTVQPQASQADMTTHNDPQPQSEAQPQEAAKKKHNKNNLKQDHVSAGEALPQRLQAAKRTHKEQQAAVPRPDSSKARRHSKGGLGSDGIAASEVAKQAFSIGKAKKVEVLKGSLKAGDHAKQNGNSIGPPQQSVKTGKARKQETLPGSFKGAGHTRQEDNLLGRMRAKLAGSQFRLLNEQLYTCPGSQAFELMREQPHLFTQYHEVSRCQWASHFIYQRWLDDFKSRLPSVEGQLELSAAMCTACHVGCQCFALPCM